MTLPYYPFYWGDYSAKTFNLTQGQHGAYMLLMRHIYCTGDRIPHDQRYDIGKAISEIDKRNVDEILAIYFLKKDKKWRNDRAFEIISKQHELHEANVNKGKKGGRPPKLGVKLGLSPDKVGPKQPELEPELKELSKNLTLGGLSLAGLEKLLRGASGWEQEPHPNLCITGPIMALIEAGANLERDVLPVVAATAQKAHSRTGWNYFIPAIKKAMADRISAGKPLDGKSEIDRAAIKADAMRKINEHNEQAMKKRDGLKNGFDA
jgi:hypothetical protein